MPFVVAGLRRGWPASWLACVVAGLRRGWPASWLACVVAGLRRGWPASWLALRSRGAAAEALRTAHSNLECAVARPPRAARRPWACQHPCGQGGQLPALNGEAPFALGAI